MFAAYSSKLIRSKFTESTGAKTHTRIRTTIMRRYRDSSYKTYPEPITFSTVIIFFLPEVKHRQVAAVGYSATNFYFVIFYFHFYRYCTFHLTALMSEKWANIRRYFARLITDTGTYGTISEAFHRLAPRSARPWVYHVRDRRRPQQYTRTFLAHVSARTATRRYYLKICYEWPRRLLVRCIVS